MKPDLLICWIKHADYPIFRETLRKHRDFFGKIIIYWSEHFRDIYFDEFIQKDLESLGNIQFLPNIEYKYGVEDWRNIATNYMLEHTDSEWVCSIEQDWFAKDWTYLLTRVEKEMVIADLIGWWQPNGKYIHPGFWFMRRESLEKTNKDFAAHDGFDHFGWITQDAIKQGMEIVSLQDLGFKTEVGIDQDCFHLGGVNQNYLEGLKEGYVFHRPEVFMVYNYWCRKANVPQDPRFIELSMKIEDRLRKEQFPEVDIAMLGWSEFFK
jgi:hypothetical protein